MRAVELLEGVSNIIYHFTGTANAARIINHNEFNLTPISRASSEEQTGVSKLYYLSTTRSKEGDYHQRSHSGVMFVLDGRKLSHRYKGKPVDYWGSSWAKPEMEDRIYSDDSTIPAKPYIIEIHALWRGEPTKWDHYLNQLADREGIPIYFYDDQKSWLLQNKKKSIPLDVQPDADEPESYKGGRDRGVPGEFTQFEQFLNGVPLDDLSYSDRSVLLSILGRGSPYGLQDAINALRAEIQHGTRPDTHPAQRKYVVDFLKKMKRHKVRTIPQLLEKIKEIYEPPKPEPKPEPVKSKQIPITDDYIQDIEYGFKILLNDYQERGNFMERYSLGIYGSEEFMILVDRRSVGTDDHILITDTNDLIKTFPSLQLTHDTATEEDLIFNYDASDDDIITVIKDDMERILDYLKTKKIQYT